MNVRMKELADRREYLLVRSELERERAARSAESVAHFFSKNTISRVVRSSAGSVVGIFLMRWLGRKLVGKMGGGFWGRQAGRFASNLWRRR
jgi:hypothetical protein